MTSIAYTNLRKEPGMDVLPRWVELVRSDKKRAARMTSDQIKALVLERKLTGYRNSLVIWGGNLIWKPFDRRRIQTKPGFKYPELPF